MGKENKKKVGIFRYAEGYDKFLMFWGTLGSIGDGLQVPLTMYVLSGIINKYGDPNTPVTVSLVDKVIFHYKISLTEPYFSKNVDRHNEML